MTQRWSSDVGLGGTYFLPAGTSTHWKQSSGTAEEPRGPERRGACQAYPCHRAPRPFPGLNARRPSRGEAEERAAEGARLEDLEVSC